MSSPASDSLTTLAWDCITGVAEREGSRNRPSPSKNASSGGGNAYEWLKHKLAAVYQAQQLTSTSSADLFVLDLVESLERLTSKVGAFPPIPSVS